MRNLFAAMTLMVGLLGFASVSEARPHHVITHYGNGYHTHHVYRGPVYRPYPVYPPYYRPVPVYPNRVIVPVPVYPQPPIYYYSW